MKYYGQNLPCILRYYHIYYCRFIVMFNVQILYAIAIFAQIYGLTR